MAQLHLLSDQWQEQLPGTLSPKEGKDSSSPSHFMLSNTSLPLLFHLPLPTCHCQCPYWLCCSGGIGRSCPTPAQLFWGLGSVQDTSTSGGQLGIASLPAPPRCSLPAQEQAQGSGTYPPTAAAPLRLSPTPKQSSWSGTGAPLAPRDSTDTGSGRQKNGE